MRHANKYIIPEGDKEIFIYPPLSTVKGLIESNINRINKYNLSICGVELKAIRNQIRLEVVEKARRYTNLLLRCWDNSLKTYEGINKHGKAIDTAVIIQTGHAPDLYHPGIWLKNHLTYLLANDYKGIGINMILDNALPEHDFILIPNLNNPASALVERVEIFKSSKGVAFEELVSAHAITNRREEMTMNNPSGFTQGTKNDTRGLNRFTLIKDRCLSVIKDIKIRMAINKFIDLMADSSRFTNNIGEQVTFARRRYEEDFDIHNLEIPISQMTETEGFLIFFIAIAMEYDKFASIYNLTLDKYRKKNNIRSPANPLPDLRVEDGLIELPFWVWMPNETRKRMFIRPLRVDQLEIMAEDSFQEDHIDRCTISKKRLICLERGQLNNLTKNLDIMAGLTRYGVKIRPKALTNTIFSRLLFSDLFIHGIGGAKYDIITDSIIKKFFGVEPPGYITASATLYPPFERFEIDTGMIKALENDLRYMCYNPEKYVSDELLKKKDIKRLILEKQGLLAEGRKTRIKARERFIRIREINALLCNYIQPILNERVLTIDTLKGKLRYNSVIENRNYPIFLYPEDLLKEFYKDVLLSR